MQATALADATMASATSPDNNHIPEIGPTTGHVPNKLVADTYTFQQNQWMETIDVTDGGWKPVYLWTGSTADNTGKVNDYVTNTIGQISMQDVIGIPPDVAISTSANARKTVDSTLYYSYIYGKLQNISVHAKNFLVTVERDSSGGVQWKDEPIFEVQTAPVHRFDANTSTNATYGCPNTYTTSLKEGLKWGNSFTMASAPRTQYYGFIAVSGTPTPRYVRYQKVFEWLSMSFPQVPTGSSITYTPDQYWYPLLHEPFYATWIRCINIPRGLSNIKVSLSYSSELRATWSLQGRVLQPEIDWIELNFPREGENVDAAAENMSITESRKRKLTGQQHGLKPLSEILYEGASSGAKKFAEGAAAGAGAAIGGYYMGKKK